MESGKRNRGCYIRTTEAEQKDARELSEMTGLSISDIYREGYKLYKKLVNERLMDVSEVEKHAKKL